MESRVTIDEQIEHQQGRVTSVDRLYKRLCDPNAERQASDPPRDVVAESLKRETAILASLTAHRTSGPMAEQLLVQLAGVLVAADGGATGVHDAKQGDYGWSPAFKAVKKLRQGYDALERPEGPLLARAIAFAVSRHGGQLDKSGQPYILHLLRVMNDLPDGVTDVRRAAAVLHDVVEDKHATFDEITLRFGESIAVVVNHLTRRAGESYKDFILRCYGDERATQIKLADLRDNMRLDRIPSRELPGGTIARLKKYTLAYMVLSGVMSVDEYRDAAE